MQVNNCCQGKGYKNYGNQPWYKFAGISASLDTRCAYCKSIIERSDPERARTLECLERSKFTSIDCDSIKDKKLSAAVDCFLTVQFTNRTETVPFLPNPAYRALRRHGVWVINAPAQSDYQFTIQSNNPNHWFTYEAVVGDRRCNVNGGVPLYYKSTNVRGFEPGGNPFTFVDGVVIKLSYCIWKKEAQCRTEPRCSVEQFTKVTSGTTLFYLMHETQPCLAPAVDYQMHLLDRFVIGAGLPAAVLPLPVERPTSVILPYYPDRPNWPYKPKFVTLPDPGPEFFEHIPVLQPAVETPVVETPVDPLDDDMVLID